MTENEQASVAKVAITSEPTSREPGSPLIDRQRLPRLLMSFGLAAVLLGGAAVALARVKPAAPAPTKKKTTVTIAITEPTTPKPPPPVPTVEQHEPTPERDAPRPVDRPAAHVALPTPASTSEGSGGTGDAGSAEGTDPYEGGMGPSTPAPPRPPPPPPTVAPPPPPPPPPPEAKKPVRITEDMEPPVPISMGAPGYPAGAKAAGVEGTVVIQYVVTESGAVTSVQVVKGPPELTGACVAAVSGWKFKPARSNGAPVSVVRQARFPFRIKT